MTPVVLIASHNRVEITRKNIASLLRQSVKPQVVLVVTKENEANYYRKLFPQIDVSIYSNHPLGDKWQFGVNRSKRFNPDPLIITGSDDILGKKYVENACILVKSGYHFVGLKRWYVYSEDVLYQYDYKANLPLGGGRAYSSKLLKEINYKIFDIKRDVHLDDYGWNGVKESRLMHYIVSDTRTEGLHLVSIKGDWPMMNPFTKFNGHRNVRLISASRDKDELKYIIDYDG